MNRNQYTKKEEFDEKVLDLRRVARVTAGGKRFRFRATVVVGDRKGRVGVGIAKGEDVASAVSKAKIDAKKNLINIKLEDGHTIVHDVEAKYSAAKVLIKPSAKGRGIKAGGAVRAILDIAGVKNATSKCIGRTTNKLTNALAAIEALKKIKKEKPNVSGDESWHISGAQNSGL